MKYLAILPGLIIIVLILRRNLGGGFAKFFTTKKIVWESAILTIFLLGLAAYSEISWESKEQKVAKPTQWYLHWEKPPGYDGFNRYEREKPSPIIANLVGDILTFQQFYTAGGKRRVCVYILRRESANSRTFVGTWTQESPAISGKITLTLNPDGLSAQGWQTMNTDNPPVNIPTRVWRE